MVFLFILSTENYEMVKELFADNHKFLFSIAYNILKRPEIAEEAVQDTFLKLMDEKICERISKIPCPERVPYCVVIVKNLSINLYNREKRMYPADDLWLMEIKDSTDIETDYINEEAIAEMSELVGSLTLEQQQLVQLRWGDGMTYREIGDLLGIEEETIKKRGQRLLSKIKEKYESEG